MRQLYNVFTALIFLFYITVGCSDSICDVTEINNETEFTEIETVSDADTLPEEVIESDKINDHDRVDEKETISPETAQLIQQILDEYVSYSYESGIAVAVKKGDASVNVLTSGKRDLISGGNINEEAQFRIGSNTKPMTAVVLLRLMEEGLLSLEDRVGDYTDSFPKWDNITIRQLLSNTTGIPDYLRENDLLFDVMSDNKKVWNKEELLSYVAEDDLIFGPHGEGMYSDSNWLLLGMIAEQVSQKTFDQLIDQYIVEPIGLEDTFVDIDGDIIDDLPTGYFDVYQWDTDNLLSPYLGFFDVIDDRIIDVTYQFHPSVASSAGAVISSPRDINIFMRSLLKGKLVSKETLDKMMEFVPVIIYPKVVQYGLGLIRRETPEGVLYGHGGLFPGFSSDAYMNIEKDLNIVLMANYYPDQLRSVYGEIFMAVDEKHTKQRETCLVDDTLFTKTFPYQLDFRFRGIIRNGKTNSNFKDVAYVKLTGEDNVYFPLAHARKALRRTTEDGKRYLEIILSGYNDKGRRHMTKEVLIHIDEDELLSISSDNYLISADQKSKIYAYIIDTELDKNYKQKKFCFTGYAVPNVDTGIAFCHEKGQGYEAGEMLRSWGRLNMEVDPEAVADYFKENGFQRCFCRDDQGAWDACL